MGWMWARYVTAIAASEPVRSVGTRLAASGVEFEGASSRFS